jgi:HlyD family secretion protein
VAFDKAKREHDRQTQLRDKQLIARDEWESSLSAYEDAELRLKLAGEKLALLESGSTEIADRTIDNIIKSPINGTILSILVETGDPVVPLTSYQAGTELMTLAQMDDLIFKGTVDEIDVGKLSEGMPVEVEIGALPNESLNGQLRLISPKARKSEGATLFDVEVVFDEIGRSFLRAGYSANASVIINKRSDILMLPERLVTMTDTLTFVEVMDSIGSIETRPVEVGLSDGINIEIVAGVDESEKVVERPPREINPWD